jgi:hypothetical protein
MTTAEQISVQRAMSDIASAERLSERFADACRTTETPDVFSDDAIVEIKSRAGHIRLRGAEVVRAWAETKPETVNVLGTVPTVRGFVTEHDRAVWMCEVRDGRISKVVAWVVRP